MSNPEDLPSDEKELAKFLSQDDNITGNDTVEKQKAARHIQVQQWTDVLYSICKKVLTVIALLILLYDIIFPKSSHALETIIELFTISAGMGKIELVAIAIAVFVLARNLPIFVRGIHRMFTD
ncbi:MAG: hypothetical protein OXF06_02305 [Bacteroidetes bacterium]|nr:hypothetical protein [Bacteroidota bacterium]